MNPNSSKRYRYEKMFWYWQIPIALGLLIFAPDFWNKFSIFYIAILSIWALASTADGNEESAKSREALDESNNI